MIDREESQRRRESNRTGSPILLTNAGIRFESKNAGAHLIVTHNGETVDFWPGTGKWNLRPSDGRERRGVRPLIAYLKRVR